ncbi:DUF262 domain-containing protein [Reinekea marinisedimentorum]|uniref:Uncharacterized protein DUF262 n=1 Tax=Reinekea marinisedimentorum TaxID=230495 RepID=A0A4R3HRD9_9GAMM|nr:DUF262 domain-containing protein [Reinekea marinisedimentorum]TCS35532.1 uncharacterized protein DUF262 [Reinekea marinisedimentorum]
MNEEYNEEIEKAEAEQEESEDYSETPPSDIVAFNELRSCADLVRMHKAGQLIIKPDFQRDVVWSNPAQTRFIDSLVKQLPIPSMCLSLDYKTEKRLMIDGLQRISSIIKFLTDEEWRLSKLEDIDSRISGRTSGYLKEKHFEIYSRIENLTIPVTVLRCDYSKKSHLNYLFTIFHRLNTGGNKLSNQEIRNCIYAGDFNEMLKKIVERKETRYLFGLEEEKTYRYAYEELFLRVFTFADAHEKYNGRLAKYLNEYMESKKKITEKEIETKTDRINRSITLLYRSILDGKQLPKLSKSTIEALFVGIYKNIDGLEGESEEQLSARYQALREDDNFSIASLSEGLAATDKVKARISKGIEIFS